MKCPVQSGENAEILLDYCARTLDAQRAALLENHMTECVECRAFRDAQSEIWSSMDDWHSIPISPTFDRQLFARIEAEGEKPWWRQWRGTWTAITLEPALPIAAACLAVLASILFQATIPVPATTPTPVSQVQAKTDPTDIEQAETALEDLDMLRVLPGVVSGSRSADNSI